MVSKPYRRLPFSKIESRWKGLETICISVVNVESYCPKTHINRSPFYSRELTVLAFSMDK